MQNAVHAAPAHAALSSFHSHCASISPAALPPRSGCFSSKAAPRAPLPADKRLSASTTWHLFSAPAWPPGATTAAGEGCPLPRGSWRAGTASLLQQAAPLQRNPACCCAAAAAAAGSQARCPSSPASPLRAPPMPSRRRPTRRKRSSACSTATAITGCSWRRASRRSRPSRSRHSRWGARAGCGCHMCQKSSKRWRSAAHAPHGRSWAAPTSPPSH